MTLRRRALTGHLLAVALTTLAAGVPARAQVPVVGVYAGINRATFEGSSSISGFDARDEVDRNAFQFGAFGSFPLNRYLAVNPAVGYSEMGTGLDRRNGIKSDVRPAYLGAPILLNLGIPDQVPGLQRAARCRGRDLPLVRRSAIPAGTQLDR